MKTFARIFILLLLLYPAGLEAQDTISSFIEPAIRVNTEEEPTVPGYFTPDWNSLRNYEVPEWFRDAKFGIWAHWGPQCQPEAGDWYARLMYFQGQYQYDHHLEHYGHPSATGFKDIINAWKAEAWDPDSLVSFYKHNGAKYFFAMGNHHDNLDMWDSRYQEWNTLALGPKKNIISGWEAAARKNGLPFGISLHATRAWSWYEGAAGSDTTGELTGVPYDGVLTKEDGNGTWWEGLDPQELYAQNHEHSKNWNQHWGLWSQWNWNNGVSLPDQAYCDKFYNRTMDVIRKYHPDLIYFDDTTIPLWPVSDAGLKILANYYNLNMQQNDGKPEGVVFGKVLTPLQRDALVWDIERGVPPDMLPFPWQTCTCIGGWHYDRALYERNGYKSSLMVIQMLVDIISKNGNLLLNIPVRGDGSIDEKEVAIVKEIGSWLKVNGEAVYGTRPWIIFGEGPASEGSELQAQGFNEGKGKAFGPRDIRYTTKGKDLYLFVMDCDGYTQTNIHELGKNLHREDLGRIRSVQQLGTDKKPRWKRSEEGLELSFEGKGVVVFKLEGALK